jgi:hypothetical protein
MKPNPAPPPTPPNADRINRAIAEKVNGWTWENWDEAWHGQGGTWHPNYSPMTNATQAFELVERKCLTVGRLPNGDWLACGAANGAATDATHADLKTAICLAVLRMHGIDPETLP